MKFCSGCGIQPFGEVEAPQHAGVLCQRREALQTAFEFDPELEAVALGEPVAQCGQRHVVAGAQGKRRVGIVVRQRLLDLVAHFFQFMGNACLDQLT